MSGLFQVYFSTVLVIYHNEMFNAGCLIPDCQEGTLQ